MNGIFRLSKSKAAFSISHLSVCLSCAFLVRSKKTKRRKLTYCKVDLVHTPVKARQSREERAGEQEGCCWRDEIGVLMGHIGFFKECRTARAAD